MKKSFALIVLICFACTVVAQGSYSRQRVNAGCKTTIKMQVPDVSKVNSHVTDLFVCTADMPMIPDVTVIPFSVNVELFLVALGKGVASNCNLPPFY